MNRRQKIIVGAVLAFIALLYAGVAVHTGGSGGGGASRDPGGIVGWLGDLVGSPPQVDREDMSAPCLSGDTLTIDGACTLTVAKSDTRTRQAKLHADDAVTVTTRAPQGDDTISHDAEAGSDFSVTVDSKGADITFTCADTGDTCVVTLSKED